MEEQDKLSTVMECAASLLFIGDDSLPISQGACELLLDAEKLTVLPASEEAFVDSVPRHLSSCRG